MTNKQLNSSEKVVVPNSIYRKLYNKNKSELRVVLFLTQLLNSEAYNKRTQEPEVNIKISKLNKLVSANKPLPVVQQIKSDFKGILDITFDDKELTVAFKAGKSPITYVFSDNNAKVKKSDIDLYAIGEFTTLAFTNISKLRKSNSIDLYLTLSRFSHSGSIVNSSIDKLFDACHMEKKSTKSKESMLREAIDDLNMHIGSEVINLKKARNGRVFITFNSSIFKEWQFNSEGKKSKGLTKNELLEENKSLREELERLKEKLEEQDEAKEKQEQIFKKELEMKRSEIAKLKAENEKLKMEKETPKQVQESSKQVQETPDKPVSAPMSGLITRNNPVTELKKQNAQMRQDITILKEQNELLSNAVGKLKEEDKGNKLAFKELRRDFDRLLSGINNSNNTNNDNADADNISNSNNSNNVNDNSNTNTNTNTNNTNNTDNNNDSNLNGSYSGADFSIDPFDGVF